MPEPRGFCRWCAGFLFTLGLGAFLLWLSYRPVRPRYFLVDLRLPPFANSTTPSGTLTASFSLNVENRNKHMGVLHDPINVSFAYGNRSGPPGTIPGFYQGHDKKADKTGEADAGWVPRDAAVREVAEQGKAVFRVGVVTRYRYKVLLWKGRRHWASLGAEVEVDGEGRKKAEKGIRLTSAGAPLPALAAAALAVVAAAAVVPPPLMLF